MEQRYQHSWEDIMNGKITKEQMALQFNLLQDQFNNNPKYKQQFYICTEQQKKLNRYPNVVPYKQNRVTPAGGEYINASVMTLSNGYKLIAAQAPVIPFDTFWKVILDGDVDLVVMLCEVGKQADRYWPEKQGVKESIGTENVLVELIQRKQLGDKFEERTLFVFEKQTNRSRVIRQLHWSGWEDFGAPSEQSMMIVRVIAEQVIKLVVGSKRVIIHCSAGIGRTGTMTSVIDLMMKTKKQSHYKKSSIFQTVWNLRTFRFQSVEREVQYEFLYQFLKKHLQQMEDS